MVAAQPVLKGAVLPSIISSTRSSYSPELFSKNIFVNPSTASNFAPIDTFKYGASDKLPFEKGSRILDVNFGIGSSMWPEEFQNSLVVSPRIGIDYGLTDQISVGATLSYSGSTTDYYEYKLKYKAYFLAAKASYHYSFTENIDPYIGGSLGYVNISVTDGEDDVKVGSPIGFGAHAGVRYYVKPSMALNAEIGYSSFTFLTFGVSVKL